MANTTIGTNNVTKAANFSDALYDYQEFVKGSRVFIPVIFGLIVILGLIGNLLVIIVIIIDKQMRNSANILIISLAIADLCFIIFCVPFTAVGYVTTMYPFGEIWCKIVNYLTYVSVYASVYTLVVMSLDRYLAVVHPLSSMKYRTGRNAVKMVVVVWVVVLLGNSPLVVQNVIVQYEYYGDKRSACINVKLSVNREHSKLFYGCFFAFGYMLPLSVICVLYGCMLKRLLYGSMPGEQQRADGMRSKRRASKMIVIVVVIFALCWLPIHIIFLIQNFGPSSDSELEMAAAQMIANCLAYMNSCVNPILYNFLSEKFRRSFRKIVC